MEGLDPSLIQLDATTTSTEKDGITIVTNSLVATLDGKVYSTKIDLTFNSQAKSVYPNYFKTQQEAITEIVSAELTTGLGFEALNLTIKRQDFTKDDFLLFQRKS